MPKHPAKRKRVIMRALKIQEISGVDVPAQAGATAVIMKRNDTEDGVEKSAVVLLTSAEEGHSHEVRIFRGDSGGSTGFSLTPKLVGEDSTNHDHPWVMSPQGQVIIGMNDGHAHTVEADQFTQALMAMAASRLADEVAQAVGKRQFTSDQRKKLADEGKALPDGSFPIVTKEDLRNAIQAFGRASNKAAVARHIKKRARALGATDTLPEDGPLADLLKSEDSEQTEPKTKEDQMATEETKKTDAEAKVEDLTAQLDRANSIATLTDADKAHFAGLEGTDADAFLAKSADERKAEVDSIAKAAQESDPVVYTTKDGVELRKSSGEALISVAKSNDVLRDENADLRKSNEDAELAKRAAELEHIPGDEATRIAMLKAIDGIEDKAQRETALNALKAQNEAMGQAFETYGHANVPTPGSPQDGLDKLAKTYAEKHDVTLEVAMTKVLETQEGSELYTKTVN